MILILAAILFFWIVLTLARGVAGTFPGFLLICAALAYAFGAWIIVGVVIAVAGLLWLARRPATT